MTENEKILSSFDSYLNQLEQIDTMLNKLFTENNIDSLEKKLSLAEYAKLNVSCAYALNSFYYCNFFRQIISKFLEYMKINGIPFENHKINEELVNKLNITIQFQKRVKQYMQKVQEALKENSGEIEETKQANPIKLNQNAAARLIKTSLAEDNSKDLKRKEKTKNIWAEETNEIIQKKTKLDKEKQVLHKGAVMPSSQHLKWKEKIEEMLK